MLPSVNNNAQVALLLLSIIGGLSFLFLFFFVCFFRFGFFRLFLSRVFAFGLRLVCLLFRLFIPRGLSVARLSALCSDWLAVNMVWRTWLAGSAEKSFGPLWSPRIIRLGWINLGADIPLVSSERELPHATLVWGNLCSFSLLVGRLLYNHLPGDCCSRVPGFNFGLP